MSSIIMIATILSFLISYAIHKIKLGDAKPYTGRQYIDENGVERMENNHTCNKCMAKIDKEN
jgi:hypothetical protein